LADFTEDDLGLPARWFEDPQQAEEDFWDVGLFDALGL
jgi:hypothetical protein